jgi:hypothetical protein
MDDFPDSRYEPKRLAMPRTRYTPVACVAAQLRMAHTVQEFQQFYTEQYGHPADLVGNLITTSQNYQLLRGYLLGKGYSFAEIDAPDGLWPLTRSAI